MSERASIVNMSGDHEETLLQLAKHLGTNKIRRKLFNEIYGRGSRPRSKKQIMGSAGITAIGNNAQQAQNQLDHLAKYHLIVRLDNDGSAKDGSKYLYRKESEVRANRKTIIKYADNPKAAEKVPTKRRPDLRVALRARGLTRRTLKKKKRLTVLYLAANPDRSNPVRVDVEMKRVQDEVRGSLFRDNITLQYRPAANLKSLINGLNDHRPQIVHFSGHGNSAGIATDNAKVRNGAAKFLSFDLLAKAVKATDAPPQVVVLNSCQSSGAAKALLPSVKAIITMRASVSDIAATVFATHFYSGIASGQSIKSAFEQAKVGIEGASIKETDTPELLCATGIDPAKMVLT